MLSVEQNDRLTQVGPGTPLGELMRRYWQPIAVASELKENPTKFIKLLGECLVLYKDRQGRLGLIDRPARIGASTWFTAFRRMRACVALIMVGCLTSRDGVWKRPRRPRTARSKTGSR